jgi:hypothetical protein
MLLLATGVLSGCGQAEIAVLETSTPDGATLAPPPTPLVTPTLDRSATATAEASATAVAELPTESGAGQDGQASATPTPTQTPEPTATNPATATATPTPSPTPVPVMPTPTSSPTAPAPPTPTATATSGATVNYFRANVTEADPGDTITLEWDTSGAETVTLWRLMATGQLGEFWGVEASGSFDYTIPEHVRNWITFALAVSAGEGSESPPMSSVQITLRCPDEWFFANPPDICPARAALVSPGAEQHFQGGVMLWSQAEDRIYVLYAGGQNPEWGAFGDEWDPGEPESDPTLQPPTGFYQPVRGFGQVWREQPGVRERLGWALDEEMSYQTAVQRTSYAKYNETYIRAAGGGVWRLEAERSGWGKQ